MNPEKFRAILRGEGDLDRETLHCGSRMFRQGQKFPYCFARAMDRRGHHRIIHGENDQPVAFGFVDRRSAVGGDP